MLRSQVGILTDSSLYLDKWKGPHFSRGSIVYENLRLRHTRNYTPGPGIGCRSPVNAAVASISTRLCHGAVPVCLHPASLRSSATLPPRISCIYLCLLLVLIQPPRRGCRSSPKMPSRWQCHLIRQTPALLAAPHSPPTYNPAAYILKHPGVDPSDPKSTPTRWHTHDDDTGTSLSLVSIPLTCLPTSTLPPSPLSLGRTRPLTRAAARACPGWSTSC